MTSPNSYSFYYKLALKKGLVGSEDTAIIFIDYSVLDHQFEQLRHSFPIGTIHAVAIKSNPLVSALKHLTNLGAGLEAASIGELFLAKVAGAKPSDTVFDSPAKTMEDISLVLERFPGIFVNANNLDELSRYPQEITIKLGLRINPEIELDNLSYLHVGSSGSKFGEPISNKPAIIKSILSNPNVKGLHVHSGSQVTNPTRSISGIIKVVRLAEEINKAAGREQIEFIDIGGGHPVDYHDTNLTSISTYVKALTQECPQLLSGKFKVITEFGRFIHAQAGWLVSKVEYVKNNNLITHAGADLFVRECYNPGDWYHHIHLLTKRGELKESSHKVQYNIHGPLCFNGDLIDKDRLLSPAISGDSLVIADIGANTFALWSHHCSRPFPKVIGYSSGREGVDMKVIRDRDNYEQLVAFWR